MGKAIICNAHVIGFLESYYKFFLLKSQALKNLTRLDLNLSLTKRKNCQKLSKTVNNYQKLSAVQFLCRSPTRMVLSHLEHKTKCHPECHLECHPKCHH